MRKRTYIVLISDIRRKFRGIADALRRDRTSACAAESAYYIILSAVPLLILILTAARYLIPQDVTENISTFIGYMPGFIGDFLRDELMLLVKRPTMTPLSVSALAVFWSASRGIRSIRRGIRSVYGCDEGSMLREAVLGLIYTALFIVITVTMLIFSVFGSVLRGVVTEAIPAAATLCDNILKLSPLFMLAVLIAFFTLMYHSFTPAAAGLDSYRCHIPGAVSASLALVIYSRIYAYSMPALLSMSYIYGSLTAVMLLMLWLYMIMYFLLIGAEINKYRMITMKKQKK